MRLLHVEAELRHGRCRSRSTQATWLRTPSKGVRQIIVSLP
ncbi:MAG: hypothetical protein U1F49_13420 [Rubrivivax sp.]